MSTVAWRIGWMLAGLAVAGTAQATIVRGRTHADALSDGATCEPTEQAVSTEVVGAADEFDESVLPTSVRELLSGPRTEVVADPSAGQEVDPALAAEQAEWRAAYARFQDRSFEFASEVSRIIRRRFDAESGDLRGAYERLYGAADVEERLLREEAIATHEKFVNDHPNSAYTARRMFRLAELYFEQAEEDFVRENDKYFELARLFDEGKVDFLPEPPLKDYRKPIALYKRIIKDFPQYEDLGAVYYMLGYVYSDETSRHLDPFRAEETYRELIANVPDSPYRAQAFFRLGDIYFEENETAAALDYYRRILAELETRRSSGELDPVNERLYELSLYKLAWAEYRSDDLRTAISRFAQLLDWAEDKEARTGTEADLKPESVRYMAISLVDLATSSVDPLTGGYPEPVEFAVGRLAPFGDRPWVFPVLEQLASVLMEQARYENAIAAYQKLQMIQPLHPHGPDFQMQVITLYQNLSPPQPEAAAQARVVLTNSYGLESPWFQANRNNKQAIAAATTYILESLKWVAYTLHTRARETQSPDDYLAAAGKYGEYLERYPFAKDAYELNYYLADCYFWVGAQQFEDRYGHMVTGWEKAIEQYARLFGFPETEYRDEAVLGILFAYNYLWKSQGEDVTALPEALANIKPPLGEVVQVQRLPLTELEQNYIRAVRWTQREVPEFTDLAVVLYDLAQIYYYRNHITRARALFEELIQGYPDTDYASFAGGLLVDSYLYTGDLDGMRSAAERIASLNLGSDESLRIERNETFEVLKRQALFKQGEVAYENERFGCALLSFADYYDRYGAEASDKDPRNIDLVVYNIAQSYSKIGKTDRSNEYFELLLADFPHSEQAPRTFWRMASNYERILELDKAVRYYSDLLKYHPGDKDAAAALYNSAFLQVGLGRFKEAALAYERYHKQYVTEADAKALLFRAARMWEAAGDSKSARRVYAEWLDLYGADDPDRWVETQYKLAGYLRDEGKAKKADELEQLIVTTYPTVRDRVGAIGTNIAASIGFRPVKAEYDAYAAFAFPKTEDQAKLSEALQRKRDWNQQIIQRMDQFVIDFLDFEWQSAALYYKALSIKNHADTWTTSYNPYQDCFDNGDPDCEQPFFVYQDLVAQQAEPLYAAATQRFVELVDLARTRKKHTVWITRALEELSKIDPNAYPVPKEERRALIPSEPFELPPPVTSPEGAAALGKPVIVAEVMR